MVKQTENKSGQSEKPAQKKKFNKPFKKKPNSNQTKKKNIVVSPLKQAYTNISKSLANPELLKQRINEFISLIEKDFLGTLGKLLGSKGLQLVIKYGTSDQRKRVFLLMMTIDIEKVLKGKYAYYFLRKLLSKARSDKIKKMFLDFFKNNFRKLFQSKATFKYLDLYVTNISHSQRIQAVREHLTENFFDEFSFKEFIDEIQQKPKLIELEISQLYLLTYFHRIPVPLISPLLNILMNQLDYMMKVDNASVVLLLNALFTAVDFKQKKEIMKKCLKEKFWDYYSQNKFFIGFLTHFMSEINDEKVMRVTLCKRGVERFIDFLSSVSHSKFLFLLFSDKTETVFMKEKSLFGPFIRDLLGISKLPQNSVFLKNCEIIRNSILSSSEFATNITFEFITRKTQENSQYSLLFGYIFGHYVQLESSGIKIAYIFENLTESINSGANVNESLLTSSAGHRLVKRLVQSMSQAHSEVVGHCQQVFEKFVEQCKVRFDELVNSRGVFVIVSLVENEHYGEEMKSFVMGKKVGLEAMEQTGGIKLLLKVIG
jgi:hypothetical protein